jgi:hypothetical protein
VEVADPDYIKGFVWDSVMGELVSAIERFDGFND